MLGKIIPTVFFWRQLLISSGVWLSFYGFGLSTGACTVLIPQLRKEANSTDAVSENMASWITAGNSYGSFIAVIFTTILTPIVGRKPIFQFAAVATIASNIIFYFSLNNTQILISQLMQGVNGACMLTINLMVICEYTSSNYRGVFLTIKTVMMYWGIWTSNAMGTFFHWKTIGVLQFLCSVYTLLTSMVWPESPYWLAETNRWDDCTKSHKWLKGEGAQSKKELELLYKSYKSKQEIKGHKEDTPFFQKTRNLLKELSQREFYKPTLCSICIICMYHSTGKLIFSVYCIDIIKKITKDERTSYIAMLFLDGITVFGMCVGCALSKLVKRRTLLFSSTCVGIASLVVTSGYLYLIHLSLLVENKYVTVTLLAVFSIAISMGPIVLSSSLAGELAPLKLRSLSFFITIFINFVVAANTVKIAPLLFTALKNYGVFLLFGIMSSIFLLILFKYLPETKDKTLHEIRDLMIKSS